MVSEVLDQLLREAETHSSGRFTLDAHKAREKLAAFRLNSLEEICLCLMRAILQSGARQVKFQQDSQAVCFDFDGPGFADLKDMSLLDLALLEGKRAYTWLGAAILCFQGLYRTPVSLRTAECLAIYQDIVEKPRLVPADPGNHLQLPLSRGLSNMGLSKLTRWLHAFQGRSREFRLLSEAFCQVETPIYLNGLLLRSTSLPIGEGALHLDASQGRELRLRVNPQPWQSQSIKAPIPFRAYLWLTPGASQLEAWLGGAACGKLDWDVVDVSGLLVCSALNLDASLTQVVRDPRWREVCEHLAQGLDPILARLPDSPTRARWLSPGRMVQVLPNPSQRERIANLRIFPLTDGSSVSWTELQARSWLFADRLPNSPDSLPWSSGCLYDPQHSFVAGLHACGVRLCNADSRMAIRECPGEIIRARSQSEQKWLEEAFNGLGDSRRLQSVRKLREERDPRQSVAELLDYFRGLQARDLDDSERNRQLLLAYLEACCLAIDPGEELSQDCPIGRLSVGRFKNNAQCVTQLGQLLSKHLWLTLSGPERLSSPEGSWSISREVLQLLEARLGNDYFSPDLNYHNPLSSLGFAGSTELAINLFELKVEPTRLLAQTSRGPFQIDRKSIVSWSYRPEQVAASTRYYVSFSQGLWNHHWSWPAEREISLQELLGWLRTS